VGGRYFFGLFFYIIVNLAVMNLVVGIIVDSFAAADNQSEAEILEMTD
jgi:hypothetical protein